MKKRKLPKRRAKAAVKRKIFRKKRTQEGADELIQFDERIVSYNVFDMFERQKATIPAAMQQIRAKYDFHYLSFDCDLIPSTDSRGVKKFEFKSRIVGGRGGRVKVEHTGPRTRWVKRGVSLDIDLYLDFGESLKFVSPIKPPGGGRVTLSYQWRPQVGAVIAGQSANRMRWKLEKHAGRYYLDGTNRFIALIRRERGVRSMRLQIYESESEHRRYRGNLFSPPLKNNISIPIEFSASKVS